VVWNEAVKINGADPDFHRRDLWNAIQMGDYPSWELGLQLFDEEFAQQFAFDVLDATKIIPEEEVPVRRVGRLVLDRCVDNFFAETEQVAFGTLNIVPGIDFSNDPLLQGRNFSYLDTQLKRLGSPNFTQIPVNAPKCPMHHFQQDGHMAMVNPKGRVNYEPNSWNHGAGGPRESLDKGFRTYPAEEAGPKLRLRSESFADHYSQARQFYISQTETEQQHIADALIFELSKVETLAIRARLVSHLLNIDMHLAQQVADGLRLQEMPRPADAARPTLEHLPPSPALSIALNGPTSFAGRKVGALVTDGVDSNTLQALKTALEKEGALLEIIAPHVGGVKASDGSWIEAVQQINGAPSVLYDAVALLPSAAGVEVLMKEPTARDFVADAFTHCKFIGYAEAALPLFEKAGVPNGRDGGCVALEGPESCAAFVAACRQLRFWMREAAVQHV
jgi:catalase